MNINTKIFTKTDNNQKLVSILLYLKTGWKNDPKHLQGLSHFLEHLLSRVDIEKTMKVRYYGGERILQTAADFIRINHYVPKEYWKEQLEIVLDHLYKNEITDEKVNNEVDLIIKEVHHWQSYPQTRIFYNLRKLMFFHHPYSNSHIGIPDHFKKMTAEFLQYYRECFWDDIMVVVAGDVENQEVEDKVLEYTENLDLNISQWETIYHHLPENGQVVKKISIGNDINFTGFCYLIKNPTIDDISTFYILNHLLWFKDPLIDQIIAKYKFHSKNYISHFQLSNENFIHFTLILHRDHNNELTNLNVIWEELAKNFINLKEKILIHLEIMGFRSKSFEWANYHFVYRDFDQLVNNISYMNENKFLKAFEKIDRSAIIFSER